ncbi:MAG: hypothetical protein M3P18_21120 [Actinomycetota bacterium]|nr:hypothetical protein [Actinomycetota bacterium]
MGIAAVGLAYVVAPLTRHNGRRDRTPSLSAELDARKRAALTGIVDLEGERAIGKLNDDDFETLKSEYEAEAMVAIAELDQLGVSEEDDDVEREIAELKARLANGDSI